MSQFSEYSLAPELVPTTPLPATRWRLGSERLGDLPTVTQLSGRRVPCPSPSSRPRRGQGAAAGPHPFLHPICLPDLESIYLQDSLLSGPSQDDSLLAFSSPGLSPDSWPSPEEPPVPAAGPQTPSPEQQHRRRLLGGLGPDAGHDLRGSLPSVDSGSLSEEEDEVFYN